MNYKRIGRALICLLLIFCLILNIAPPKAEATGAGLAGTFTAVSGVTVSAPLAIGAAAIALGVMAKNTNPLVFENMVNDAVASLSAAGEWVKDGTVELLQTIDSAGQKAYYVSGDMLEDMRSFLFNGSESCSPILHSFGSGGVYIPAGNISLANYRHIDSPVMAYAFYVSTSTPKTVLISNHRFTITNTGGNESLANVLGDGLYYADAYGYDGSSLGLSYIVPYAAFSPYRSNIAEFYEALYTGSINGSELYSAYDLTLGYLPSQDETLTDTTVVAFHPYVAKALRTRTGGSGGSGDNGGNQKWWLRLALGATLGATLAQTQQQVIELPQVEEIPDISIGQEFDVEYGTYIETDTNTGTEVEKDYITLVPTPSPGTGGESGDSSGDEGSDNNEETKWFQRIITGIEELPSRFENWITDCKTAIEELPSKFADWFNKIIEILGNIWEWLQNLVSSLIDALKQLLVDLFAPSAEFIANKVNALCAKYPYLDTFLALGTDLKAYFLSLGTKPPIIYIDLGAATGSYVWGGSQVFVDLTWYKSYKSTMDAIIGAFIWLWLAWRVFLSLPGLINGASGAAGSVIRYGERSTKSNDGGADK